MIVENKKQMKTCRYLVEIEMPDGDMVSANWLKDIIQEDCDSEDKERQKVSVRELDLPKEVKGKVVIAYNNGKALIECKYNGKTDDKVIVQIRKAK